MANLRLIHIFLLSILPADAVLRSVRIASDGLLTLANCFNSADLQPEGAC